VSGETQTAVVTFVCCSYTPDVVTIGVGEDVEWQGDFTMHPLVSQDGLWPVHGTGTVFTHTFTQVGEYWYYCGVHGGQNGTGMSGKVIVVDEVSLYLPWIVR
jgi:plastocyanin